MIYQLISAVLSDNNQKSSQLSTIRQPWCSDTWQPSLLPARAGSLSLSLGFFGGKCTSLKMLLTVAEFIAPDEQHVLLLLLLLNPPFEVWLQVQDLLELSRA